MAWYRNKLTRIQYIMSQHVNIPSDKFIRNVFERYIAVKLPISRTHNDVVCTRCGHHTELPKSATEYICDCGYKHTRLKTSRFKNMRGRFVIKSITDNINNYFLVYYNYHADTLTFTFDKYLIAKSVAIPEKLGYPYLYNIAFARPNKYDAPVYAPRDTVAESRPHNLIDYDYIYNTAADLSRLKYIDVNDPNILGYEIDTLIRNNYLIEILQKYKSSYLFHELKDVTDSDKILDMFNMRDTGLSNKQVVSIIKYYSRKRDLDVSLYKDYINDLKFLGLTLNYVNLCNHKYRARHQSLSNKIADIKQKNKDKYIQSAYRKYNVYESNGVYISYPQSQRDLNKESSCLNHCVRRYADDIIDNKLKIFFVRVNPEEPFITAEVKQGKITQFRGKDNLVSHIEPELLSKCRKVLEEYIENIEGEIV